MVVESRSFGGIFGGAQRREDLPSRLKQRISTRRALARLVGQNQRGEPSRPPTGTFGALTYAVSDLSRRDIEQYHHGFANRSLWPICRYRLDLADLSECNAAAYFRVNERFARPLHKMCARMTSFGCTTIISFPWREFCGALEESESKRSKTRTERRSARVGG